MKQSVKISLRELQLLEIEILDYFVDFCNKNNLKYTLIGGTMLGAVRHKGFIPWDDDIDVGMPRPDYEKFKELSKKEFSGSSYMVLDGENSNYSFSNIKIINKNAVIKKQSRTHCNESDYLWIDIMAIDGIGNDLKKAFRIKDSTSFYQKALGRSTSIPWKLRENEHGVMGYLKCFYRQLFRVHNYTFYKRKLEKLNGIYSFDDSSYVAIIATGYYGRGEIMKKEDLVKYTNVEFENKKYNSMGGYISYLKGIYGDYMKLPPEEKRIQPHSIEIILLDEKNQ